MCCEVLLASFLKTLACGVGHACMGTVVHPCRVKSFRKAVSAVMDDLELLKSIIEQLTPLHVANNMIIKLFQKVCVPC